MAEVRKCTVADAPPGPCKRTACSSTVAMVRCSDVAGVSRLASTRVFVQAQGTPSMQLGFLTVTDNQLCSECRQS